MSLQFSNLESVIPQGARWIAKNPKATISGIKRICCADNVYAPNYLYTGSLSDLRKADAASITNVLIYARDKDSISNFEFSGNAIIVFNHDDFYSIIDYLVDILSEKATIGEISRHFQLLSTSNNPTVSILQYAFDLLSNPIIVTDVAFKALSMIGTNVITDEPHWEFCTKNGFMSQEYVEMILHGKEDHFSDSIEEELIFDDKETLGTNYNQLSSKMVLRGRIIGFFKVLEYNHPFTELDKQVILMAASYISPTIAQYNRPLMFSPSIKRDFLVSILNGDLTDVDEIERRKNSFGIKLYDFLHLIAIDMPLSMINIDTMHLFQSELKNCFDKDSILIYNNNILILLDTKHIDELMSPSQMKTFEATLSQYDCVANISAPFESLHLLPRHYQQTQICSELRKTLDEGRRIVCYLDDIVDYHMIFHYGRVQNLDNLLHPAVIKLINMGEAGVDLLNTLFAYATHLCNITITANALHMHYNTLKYRIDKITNITGVDFSNSDDVFRIILSQKVLEIKDNSSL